MTTLDVPLSSSNKCGTNFTKCLSFWQMPHEAVLFSLEENQVRSRCLLPSEGYLLTIYSFRFQIPGREIVTHNLYSAMYFNRNFNQSGTHFHGTFLKMFLLHFYGGISMTKLNDHYLKSNRPNHKCINPKLNGNKSILQMAITQKGITQIAIT